VGVRELRSKPHRHGDCAVVRGRLRAAVAEGVMCNNRSLVDTFTWVSRCSGGWVLSDLSDPTVEVRNGSGDATPTVILGDPGALEGVVGLDPGKRFLLACNRNGAGKPIMPAGTRSRLPSYAYEEAAALNKGLGNMTVVAFGGSYARDEDPDGPEGFEGMYVTHLCRLR
jgi:hypothetical protein